ncbi:5-methylcytosine restriction system specificity protein McrC [Paenibacillus sp. LjRoot56]|uniref:5-methylcytosine restriction system specificity protein McrC n=1 Tax=Paenibacillus sp. LjRoot56 TaxID=3342333 RepID=UPI003ED0C8EE
MAREIIPHKFNDWSQLDKNEEFLFNINLLKPDINFGIHKYKDRLWTSGFVGVGRVYDHNQIPIQSNGKEHIVVISSQYGMDPWKMLEKVMADEEYENYIEELEKDGKFLFRVFYDQPLIQLAQDEKNDGDLLYALSFVNSCYFLCKKGLKKTMYHQEENYNSKVRGKIDVKKNIRENTCRGRNDRFYCKYMDFTEDNIENRILKVTLMKCKSIVEKRFKENTEITKRVHYCVNVFRRVKSVTIKTSDFNNVSVSGLYMYYKPLLQQARSIFSQKYHSYSVDGGKTITKSVYTIPYMINMETLFEFYARTMIKKSLENDKYELDDYSKKIFLDRGATCIEDTEKGIHLMPYCIPDIVIRDKGTKEALVVIDAKYKSHDRTARTDSLQLLSYVLLTGVNRCGFVFPGAETKIKLMKTSGTDYLSLQTPFVDELKYYELILGNIPNEKVLEKLFL